MTSTDAVRCNTPKSEQHQEGRDAMRCQVRESLKSMAYIASHPQELRVRVRVHS